MRQAADFPNPEPLIPQPPADRHIGTIIADAILGENPKDRLGVKKPSITAVVPLPALFRWLGVMNLGAAKYGPFNWRKNAVKASVYIDAMLRHAALLASGQDIDEESGEPHEAHIMACASIMIDAREHGNLIDDRAQKSEAVARIIKAMTKS
jgi:hypothetical protein